MVDLESLDLAKWPKAHTIQGYEAILQPGDVLVVPAFWWIQQEELSKETVALQSLCQRRGLDAVAPLSPQQAEVRAGRAVESLVSQSDAVGANKAKGFFQGILAGDLAASTIDRFTLEVGFRARGMRTYALAHASNGVQLPLYAGISNGTAIAVVA